MHPRRLKSYLIAAFGICAVFPAAGVAQYHATGLDLSGKSERLIAASNGINPDYSLPAPSTSDKNFTTPSFANSEKSFSENTFPAAVPARLPARSTQNPGDDRDVSWRKLPMNILHDQKDLWLFPLQLARGRHWLPALFIVGSTAVFIATDPQTMPHFRQTTDFHDFNRVFSSTSTGVAMAVVPAVFYAVSLMRHDSYDQKTVLFAGEAVVDDTVLMVVTKAITRRQRPTELPVAGPYNDTFFHSNGSIFGKGTSFPSGHAMMAFSIATIFARRYHEHRWVPFVAYAAASAIAFSRVTTGAHFPADAFFGASIGYVIARYDVLRGQ
jgi:membrane-associated phospholipid phosphatase